MVNSATVAFAISCNSDPFLVGAEGSDDMFVISEEPGRNGHHDSFLGAHIELLQGTNNVKKVMEVYTEDSTERPLFAIIETPGTGNVFRLMNTATVKLPLSCYLELFLVEEGSDDMIVTNEELGRTGHHDSSFLARIEPL
jgi:hypothetical protein